MNKRYLLGRTVQAAITGLTVLTITFALIRLIPGGPMDYLRAYVMQQTGGGGVAVSSLMKNYINIQPNEPLWKQYIDYVTSVLSGDFGKSIWYQEPVVKIIAQALPWTLFVVAVGELIAYAIAIALGALMAYSEGGRLDFSGTVASIVFISIPYYILGVLFLWGFSYELGWFPTGGLYNSSGAQVGLNISFILDVLYHAALPILSVVLSNFGLQTILMRGNSISILGSDFLRVARLRGLKEGYISYRYVGRNAILPMWTNMLITLGFAFGGSIVLEQIFKYHGMGWYLLKAINARDYPLMMGAFIVITWAILIGVFIADLTYGFIDPRIKAGGEYE